MEYQNYIDLGFERHEMNDNVEFKQTGYYGYSLEKKLKKGLMICVNSGELERPHLYIRKKDCDTNHIILITSECVIDLCDKFKK